LGDPAWIVLSNEARFVFFGLDVHAQQAQGEILYNCRDRTACNLATQSESIDFRKKILGCAHDGLDRSAMRPSSGMIGSIRIIPPWICVD
jgi:hypothetical protein